MRYTDVIDSFLSHRQKACGNYTSSGETLLLFGNVIAYHAEGQTYITPSGWSTMTTAKALNYLIREAGGMVKRIVLGNNPRIFVTDKLYELPIESSDRINLATGQKIYKSQGE